MSSCYRTAEQGVDEKVYNSQLSYVEGQNGVPVHHGDVMDGFMGYGLNTRGIKSYNKSGLPIPEGLFPFDCYVSEYNMKNLHEKFKKIAVKINSQTEGIIIIFQLTTYP